MTSNFVGTVVNVKDDPMKLGRVRVRVVNHHEELKEEDLQWMTVGMPTTSASIQKTGSSPTWLEKGSIVYGQYFDGEARQVPIVMGTLHTMPDRKEDKSTVSKRALGKGEKIKGKGPDVSGAPQYPDNKVIETPSGHLIEIDDTKGKERLLVVHKSGSYIAINPNGDVIVHSVNDIYNLGNKQSNTTVDGAAGITAKGITLKSSEKINIEAKKTCTIKSSANVIIDAPTVSII